MIYAKHLAQPPIVKRLWFGPCASYWLSPVFIYFPSSLPQKVVSKSCSTQAPLLPAFQLSSASGKHSERMGEKKEMEVDALVSLTPILSPDASGNV